ncbi:DUF4031 domain-containing protein [Kitasatospora sp. NPDC090308]|uniref:DUF4031 domain-containing protein n=1 Tax=Kitasatospora sp. NPDC090308 TaxID=3364082 RepID=UPI0037F51D60
MILVDPPERPGRGRRWPHLAGDVPLVEPHAFAAESGAPAEGFDRDLPRPPAGGTPFDTPAAWCERAPVPGAAPVRSRELVARLTAAGLRVRRARG